MVQTTGLEPTTSGQNPALSQLSYVRDPNPQNGTVYRAAKPPARAETKAPTVVLASVFVTGCAPIAPATGCRKRHCRGEFAASFSGGISATPVYRWLHLPMYHGNNQIVNIERVQTGVRLEKRLVKVLKALAEHRDMSLGDLIEGIVLHAFEGQTPFSPETLEAISQLKRIYGLELGAADSHRLAEAPSSEWKGKADDEPS